jgi:hypothetical protein
VPPPVGRVGGRIVHSEDDGGSSPQQLLGRVDVERRGRSCLAKTLVLAAGSSESRLGRNERSGRSSGVAQNMGRGDVI